MQIEARHAVTARKALNYTQEAMADALQTSVRSVRRWEREGIPPSPTAVLYGFILTGACRI